MTLVVMMSLLAQLPPVYPALSAEPLTFPAVGRVPIEVVGRPALAWSETGWVLAWRDKRRSGDGSSTAHVYATPWDGGAQPRFPQGLPLPGASPVNVNFNDLQVASSPNFTYFLYALREPDGGASLTVVSTRRDAGVSGAWAGTVNVSGSDAVRFGSGVLATTGDSAVAGWFVGDEVHLVSVPGMVSVRLDAGPDAQSLSVAGLDGGLLVAWVNSASRAIATTVSATSLSPGPFVEVSSMVRAVQAVSTTPPLLTTAAGSTWQAWRGPQFFNPIGWPTINPTSTPFTVATTTSVVNLYQSPAGTTFVNAAPLGSLSTMAGQVLVAAPASMSPVALAAAPDDAMALLMRAPRVFGLPLSIDSSSVPPIVSPKALVPLLDAPPWQRAPSVVWVDPDRAFLLAWDEEQPDGGSSLMTTWLEPTGQTRGPPQVLLSSPFKEGVQPRLLRRPSGTSWGLQRRVTTLFARDIASLDFDGGVVSLGAQLATPRPLGNAVLGDALALQWGGPANSTVYAGTEPSPRFTFTGPAPTCAAVAEGSLWFPNFQNFILGVTRVPDGSGGVPPTLIGLDYLGPLSGVCALATARSGQVFMSFKSGARLHVVASPAATPQLVTFAAFDSVSGGEPLLAETSEGLIVAWPGRTPAGVEAVLARQGEVPVTLGGGVDVDNLSVASSPFGVAALAWDGFVPSAGARQVFVRLVGSFDAGSSRDGGGMPADAGVDVDGGSMVLDGGSMVLDGGIVVLDGGIVVLDSGIAVFDAGTLEEPPGRLLFQPVCGCQGGPGALSVLLALVLLRRRGAR